MTSAQRTFAITAIMLLAGGVYSDDARAAEDVKRPAYNPRAIAFSVCVLLWSDM